MEPYPRIGLGPAGLQNPGRDHPYGITFLYTVSRENLQRVFDQALEVDHETARQAWRKYQLLTTKIAETHGYAPKIGAAVFAAVSPNNDYYGNLRDTNRLLRAAAQDRGLDSLYGLDTFKVSTYGNNKRKAWRIAKGADPLVEIVAPKTRSFYLNILNPDDPHPVTIDGHMYNAWRNKRVQLNAADVKFTRRVYEQIADDVREMSQRLGLIANVVQGVIWFAWRRRHWIKTTDQVEFWDPEFLASGLGFEMVAPAGVAPAT